MIVDRGSLEYDVELCGWWFGDDLTADDREWLAGELQRAGVEPPRVDRSWLQTELIR